MTTEATQTTTPSAKFWDKIADKYFARPISDQQIYEAKLERTRALLTPDSHILEIGCGTGGTALRHAPHVAQVLATDISPRMIEIGRQQAQEQGITNVRFEIAEALGVTVQPGSQDAVLCLSLLHLVEDPAAVLKLAFDALKPGGHLVTSTACLGSGWLRIIAAIAPLGVMLGKMPPITAFTADQLKQMIRDAGFEITHDSMPASTTLFCIARKPESAGQ